MKKLSKREFWQKMVADQKKWIEDHGGDLHGYIQNYNRRPEHEARNIFNADFNALLEYEGNLR